MIVKLCVENASGTVIQLLLCALAPTAGRGPEDARLRCAEEQGGAGLLQLRPEATRRGDRS